MIIKAIICAFPCLCAIIGSLLLEAGFELQCSNYITSNMPLSLVHTGKCIRQFDGIYAYCRYFVDRKC